MANCSKCGTDVGCGCNLSACPEGKCCKTCLSISKPPQTPVSPPNKTQLSNGDLSSIRVSLKVSDVVEHQLN